MSLNKGTKTKVLILSLTYFPYIGGAEVAIKEICERLGQNFEFDLITAKLNKNLKDKERLGEVNVFRVGGGSSLLDKYFFPLRAFKKAKELHTQNDYQIVWGMMASWGGWAALKFKEKYLKVKYLLTLQSGDSDAFIKARTWWWQWRYRKIYSKADRIQVISEWLEKRARNYGFKGRVDLVPNGTNLTRKQENKKTRKQENEKVILTVSRLVKKNGVEDLIKASKLLNCQIAKLLIVGDGPLREKLEKIAEDLGVKDKVIFAGEVKFDELGNYYELADVFCRPSLSEGFGNVFVEAMAHELPVVATPVGGIVDFLKDRETGFECEVQNPASIAEKLNYILDENNKIEVEKIISQAKKMVEEKYTWDKIASQMNEIFNELINK